MENVADKLKEKLTVLHPSVLKITDDSALHAGHAGNPDGKGQTHFTVEITSDAFAGKSRLERQRIVMDLIQPLWAETTLHAISVKATALQDSTGVA
jgi:BolA protein